MPARALREKQHPAKRSFQAIRIAVNDELAAVDRMIQARRAPAEPGGAAGGDLLPLAGGPDRQEPAWPALPRAAPVRRTSRCVCAGRSPGRQAGDQKAHRLPTAEELEENPRARSAKLRVAEKLKRPGQMGLSRARLWDTKEKRSEWNGKRRRNRPIPHLWKRGLRPSLRRQRRPLPAGREDPLRPQPKVRPRERGRTYPDPGPGAGGGRGVSLCRHRLSGGGRFCRAGAVQLRPSTS